MATIWKQAEKNCHPTTLDPRQLYVPNSEHQTLQYCELVDCCERHCCQTYCQRKKPRKNQSKCRGDFPHYILEKTIIAINQYTTEKKKRS